MEFASTRVFDFVSTETDGFNEAVPGLPFIAAILLA